MTFLHFVFKQIYQYRTKWRLYIFSLLLTFYLCLVMKRMKKLNIMLYFPCMQDLKVSKCYSVLLLCCPCHYQQGCKNLLLVQATVPAFIVSIIFYSLTFIQLYQNTFQRTAENIYLHLFFFCGSVTEQESLIIPSILQFWRKINVFYDTDNFRQIE